MCSKRGYNKKQAKRILRLVKANGHPGGRVYRCPKPECHGQWHLTSQRNGQMDSWKKRLMVVLETLETGD